VTPGIGIMRDVTTRDVTMKDVTMKDEEYQSGKHDVLLSISSLVSTSSVWCYAATIIDESIVFISPMVAE
jgi:hypothetical protein